MCSRVAAACWKPPLTGWAKANWDAALDRQLGRLGLGVVVRDSCGNLLAGRCTAQVGCLAPAAAEAKVVLLAIQLCREMGLSQVHFEGDAKSVVDSVNSAHVDSSWMGHVVDDIRLEVQAFPQWQLFFVRREGNQVAHLLAKYAVRHFENNLWLSMPPDCI